METDPAARSIGQARLYSATEQAPIELIDHARKGWGSKAPEHPRAGREPTVGAHQISGRFAYIAARNSGMWFSQQIAAPIRPAPLSITGIVAPSPCAQISRSVPVGISLRCLATRPAFGIMNNAVQ